MTGPGRHARFASAPDPWRSTVVGGSNPAQGLVSVLHGEDGDAESFGGRRARRVRGRDRPDSWMDTLPLDQERRVFVTW